jgi:hypothetical protein
LQVRLAPLFRRLRIEAERLRLEHGSARAAAAAATRAVRGGGVGGGRRGWRVTKAAAERDEVCGAQRLSNINNKSAFLFAFARGRNECNRRGGGGYGKVESGVVGGALLLVKGYYALAVDGGQALRQWRESNASDVSCGVLRDALERFAVENADVLSGRGHVAEERVDSEQKIS